MPKQSIGSLAVLLRGLLMRTNRKSKTGALKTEYEKIPPLTPLPSRMRLVFAAKVYGRKSFCERGDDGGL